jgi:hypothetical protein
MRSKAKARIALVRRDLALARESMTHGTVEVLEQAAPALAEAIQNLAKLERNLAGAPKASPEERAELLIEMTSLRRDLLTLAALSEGGLEFCRNWSNVLKSAAGYLADGSEAPVEHVSTMAVEG